MRCKIIAVPTKLVMPNYGPHRTRVAGAGQTDHTALPLTSFAGVPDDARIVGIDFSAAGNDMLELLVESDTFPDVPPGPPYERLDVSATNYPSGKAYLEESRDNPV